MSNSSGRYEGCVGAASIKTIADKIGAVAASHT
jgi:hypothetical protein